MIRTVGIACKPIKEVVCSVVPPLMRWLGERKIDVLVDKETQACIDSGVAGLSRTALAEKADLLVVLGGDGTLLSAARALHGHAVPILAVNLGALGFLTSVTLEELYPVLEQVLAGQHRTSERMMLEATITRSGVRGESHPALNDAVVNKSAMARMLDFDVYVDSDHVGRYRADGLIVATPTGSTAYSLAAGGPIIHPDLDALVITPICPHMLTNRPLVIPGASRVEVDFTASEEPVYLTLDGQTGLQMAPNDRVAVTKSSSKVKLVRPPGKTYFEILRSKLRWGER
ncbi:MAG TPA: NAD(+)/NADH kinase [Candidatus Limnocylindrales bacterium]|nr:NAD(+)/NADH kinase [Candidatus Limnocylindrales bacterium]